MSDTATEITRLSDAEDFLNHFDIPFDPAFLDAHRLKLMVRFRTVLGAMRTMAAGTEHAESYRAALLQAWTEIRAGTAPEVPTTGTSRCAACAAACAVKEERFL